MIQPWTKLKTADARYRPSVQSRIRPIFPKSIPPVPCTFRIRPCASSVVAWPMIFGPNTLNTVETAAKIMTAKTAALYRPI